MIKVLILLLLIFMSVYDIKTYTVKDSHLIILSTLIIINLKTYMNLEKIVISFLFSISVFLILYILYIVFKDKIGGGDVKLISILTLLYTFNIIYILFISSVLGIAYIIIFKNKKIPYIPFLISATIVFEIIKWYN